jgi:hypothetical protein
MLEPRTGGCLGLQPIAQVGCRRTGEELDRRRAAERDVRRTIDDAHSAGAETLLEPIVRDELPGTIVGGSNHRGLLGPRHGLRDNRRFEEASSGSVRSEQRHYRIGEVRVFIA